VRTDCAAPCALPRRQLTRPRRRGLRLFPRWRGKRNSVRGRLPGHGDDLLPARSPAPGRWRVPEGTRLAWCGQAADGTAAVISSGAIAARLPGHRVLRRKPLRSSATTSARRYRGRPASVRTSGSCPRRTQVATAAEVTRNSDATCLRVIRSSSMWLPVPAAAAANTGSVTGSARRATRAARSDGVGAITFMEVPWRAGAAGRQSAGQHARPLQVEGPGPMCTARYLLR
jgi:hypothetical protein